MTTQATAGLVTDDPGVVPRPAEPSRVSARRITQLTSIVVGLGLWEALARFIIHNTSFLAPPSLVAVRFWQMLLNGQLGYNSWVSFQELVGGFVLGVVVGVAVGAAMVQWRYVDYSLEGWISALYAAPIIALAPVLIIWFGFGL